MSEQLRSHLASLTNAERGELALDRWNQVENLAARFGVTADVVRKAIESLRPRAKADRFEWLEHINVRHELGVRAVRTAIACFSFAGEHGYFWPSQASLAKRAGYQDPAEIRRGIASLVAIGALRKVRLSNLPTDLASAALTSVREGGSGRSIRGIGYALVPVSKWTVTGTWCPSSDRDTMSLHNHQVEPQRASPGSPSNTGATSCTVSMVDTSQNCFDHGERHG
jgi:hypothetical protein